MRDYTLPTNKVSRFSAFLYGVVCYAIFLFTFLYAVGFVGNFGVPRTIDSSPVIPLGHAIVINVALLGIFSVQHSLMARPGFKLWWTQFVPQPIERSTYVLFSSLCLIALFYLWQPMGMTIWHLENPVLSTIVYLLFALGWLLVLVTTFLINHFDLFGLRQVYLYLRGQAYTQLPFVTPSLYQYIRHPLYLGWLLAFWATPTMTLAHLLFAALTTAYILVAIQLEERDLQKIHGAAYADYRRQVSMLIPWKKLSR